MLQAEKILIEYVYLVVLEEGEITWIDITMGYAHVTLKQPKAATSHTAKTLKIDTMRKLRAFYIANCRLPIRHILRKCTQF